MSPTPRCPPADGGLWRASCGPAAGTCPVPRHPPRQSCLACSHAHTPHWLTLEPKHRWSTPPGSGGGSNSLCPGSLSRCQPVVSRGLQTPGAPLPPSPPPLGASVNSPSIHPSSSFHQVAAEREAARRPGTVSEGTRTHRAGSELGRVVVHVRHRDDGCGRVGQAIVQVSFHVCRLNDDCVLLNFLEGHEGEEDSISLGFSLQAVYTFIKEIHSLDGLSWVPVLPGGAGCRVLGR